MNESKSKKINTILNIIIVLSIFFIFCIIYSSVIPNDLSEYKKEIKNLNTQISTLTEQIKNNENQITTLSENNKKLESENQKLKAEKNDLKILRTLCCINRAAAFRCFHKLRLLFLNYREIRLRA